MLAVCQPCVHTLVAVAAMAVDKSPFQPRTMTLMGGPVDTRQSPTGVNELAVSKPMEWFEKNLISTVPFAHRGFGRRVYPGLRPAHRLHADEPAAALRPAAQALPAAGGGPRETEAEVIKAFYDEYFAVLDLTAEFYLETVDKVFQRALLAKGELEHHGRPVRPAAIQRTALLTVEGGARRHLRRRPDRCGPRPVLEPAPAPEAPPPPAGRRPLRPVRRQEVGEADLSPGAEHGPGDELTRSR